MVYIEILARFGTAFISSLRRDIQYNIKVCGGNWKLLKKYLKIMVAHYCGKHGECGDAPWHCSGKIQYS